MGDEGSSGLEPRVTLPPAPPAKADSLPLPSWGLGTAIGITVWTIGATVLGGFAAAAFMTRSLDKDLQAAIMGLALTLPYLSSLALLTVMARAKGLSLADAVGLRPAPLRQILPLAFAVALGARLFAALWGLLLQALGVDMPGADIDPTKLLPSGLVGVTFTILATCIIAPLVEEMVFRGVLFPALARRWSSGVGIAVSSAAFAAVHIHPYAMVPIFVLAVVLARLYLTSRTLWLPVAVHVFFNVMGVAGVYLLEWVGRT